MSQLPVLLIIIAEVAAEVDVDVDVDAIVIAVEWQSDLSVCLPACPTVRQSVGHMNGF